MDADEAKKAAAKAMVAKVAKILAEHPEAQVESLLFKTTPRSPRSWTELDKVRLRLDDDRTLTLILSTDMQEAA